MYKEDIVLPCTYVKLLSIKQDAKRLRKDGSKKLLQSNKGTLLASEEKEENLSSFICMSRLTSKLSFVKWQEELIDSILNKLGISCL